MDFIQSFNLIFTKNTKSTKKYIIWVFELLLGTNSRIIMHIEIRDYFLNGLI